MTSQKATPRVGQEDVNTTSEPGSSIAPIDTSDVLLEGNVLEGCIIDGEHISFKQQHLIVVAYTKFRDDGRPLAREEIVGLLAKILKKNTISGASVNHLYRFLDKLDDESDPWTKKYAEFYKKNGQAFLAEVGRIFGVLLEENEEAKDRSENCKGLTKRLPHKDSNDNGWPQWDKSKIRIDQLCLGHAMAHFCKDHQGQSLIYYAGKDLLQDQVFHGRPSTSSIFQTLLQGSSKFAQKVAFIMNTDEVFRVHFGNLAHKKHKIFAKKKGHPVPQLVMPGSSSQSDLASATTGVEALSLTATTRSSFDEFIDYEAYEVTRIGGTPRPSGISNDGVKREGKGKQRRERESSSDSLGGEGSGKRKEKRPRRDEGKS